MLHSRQLCLFFLLLVVIYGRENEESLPQPWKENVRMKLLQKLQNYHGYEHPPKNVIFFLGDGMGIPAVSAARIYRGEKLNQSYSELPFSFEEFPYSALIKTSSYNKHVTDSAASAVALFTGHKVDQDNLGLLPGRANDCSTTREDHIHDGIAELAINKGLSAGFVTTDKITGATPGATYVKGVNRDYYSDNRTGRVPLCQGKDIASQLLNYPARDFKVVMGGGSRFLLPTPLGERQDTRDITKEWLNLGGGHRMILDSVEDFENLDPRRNSKVLGVFAPEAFPFYLDEALNQKRTVPRLKEMTEKAVSILERDNRNGYFLMIEGGLIDVAEHRNQMRVASEELLEFDAAIRQAREMTNPEETLIIVTADHSHALSLPGYLEKASSIFTSQQWPAEVGQPSVPGIFFATGPGAQTAFDFTEEEGQNPHFASPAAIPTGYGSHGGEDVGLWADGPYSWLFSGTMENAEVAHLVKQLLCLYPNRTECVLFSRSSYSRPHRGCSSAPIWIAVISLLVALLTTALSLILLKRNSNKVYT